MRQLTYQGTGSEHQALLALHGNLKNNIHKIGSIISMMATGQKRVQSIDNSQKVGWLRKLGGNVKTWKRRWFVLKMSDLFYFKGPQVKSLFPKKKNFNH